MFHITQLYEMLYNYIYNTLIRSHPKLSNENSYTDKHTIAVLLQAAHFAQPSRCHQVWIEMSIVSYPERVCV